MNIIKGLIRKINELKMRIIKDPPIEGSFKKEDYQQAVQCASCPYKVEAPVPCREAFPNYNVGIAIKGARYKEGFTQQEAANKLGISRSTLSRMENCKKEIDEEMAKRLGQILNIGYKVFYNEPIS